MTQKIIIGIYLLLIVVSRAATHYVSPSGTNNSPYTNWAGAATQIQWAVNASTDGDTVLVTNGTYDTGGAITPGYNLNNRVCVTQAITLRSVNGPDVTIIKGAGSGDANAVRCAFLTNSASIIGFTLTNGYALSYADAVFNRSGAGILLLSNSVASNCVISGNRYGYYSTGAFVDAGATMQNCVISGNSSDYKLTDFACGVMVGGTLNNCVISGNIAHRGAVFLSGVNAVMQNCLVVDNVATQHTGGVFINVYGTINNCTIASNTSVNSGGAGGVYIESGSATIPPSVVNCIVWGNSNALGNIRITAGGTVQYTCSDPVYAGTGNISNNPLFVATNSGNYRLSAKSPCINVGTNQTWMTDAVDLDGQPRIHHGTVDMGAYENQVNKGTIIRIH